MKNNRIILVCVLAVTLIQAFTLLVFSDQQAGLQIQPTAVEFQCQLGGPSPSPQAVTISNNSGDLLKWRASSDVSWIVLGSTESALSSGRTIKMWLFVDDSGLGAGTYHGTITFSSAKGQTKLAVTLTIVAKLAITAVRFPAEIHRVDTNRKGTLGTIEFTGNKNIDKVTFEVVDGNFEPFEFNPQKAQSFSFDPATSAGSFKFSIACYIMQTVKLKVTLFDTAGNRSEPWEFSFKCPP